MSVWSSLACFLIHVKEKKKTTMGTLRNKELSIGITGLSLIAIGLVCIARPGAAIMSMAWLIGLLILMSGTATVFRWFTLRSSMPWSGSILLSGLFQVLVGMLFLNHNAILLSTFSLILAIGLLLWGVSLVVRSIQYRRLGLRRWPVTLALGAGSTILGFWCFGSPVLAGSTIISTVLGVCLIIAGVIYLTVHFGLFGLGRGMTSGPDSWIDEQ